MKKTIADLEARISVVPTRESELVELNRDYETLKATYASLLRKQEDSKLSANLERRQIGETFKVIDAATVPQRPFNSFLRLQIILGGAAGGLVLGLAIVGFLEYSDSSFKSEDDVIRMLSLPVLAMVPMMASDKERAATAGGRLLLNVGGGVALLGSAAVVRPLGVAVLATAPTPCTSVSTTSGNPVRADVESAVPVPHASASRGAEQSGVRPFVGQGRYGAHWRGRHG